MDKRIIKTDKAISTALMKLMETRPLSQLSVSAICREANIDRKTFYSRFETPEDAFATTAERMVDQIILSVSEDLKAIKASRTAKLSETKDFELRLKLFFGRVAALYETDVEPHKRRNRHVSIDALFPYFITPLSTHIKRGALGDMLKDSGRTDLASSLILVSSLWMHSAWLSGKTDVSLAERSDEVCHILIHGLAKTAL